MLQHKVPPKLPFFILLLMVSYGTVGALLFTPALPEIQMFFQVSVGKVQSTVTIYLIGFALGQLPYGPLAKGWGRKKALRLGIILGILGSVLCGLSSVFQSFEFLVFARFLQALGASAGLKITYTMIADVYDQSKATQVISRIIMTFSLVPGIAIAIGGLLTEFIQWESCF
ncbi:MAG TPA: MFS transporter, partial [Candidatus Babeliaceae bacterium]|nr:MFS transporter [Candidatus Babeliaceae bacterium]